MNGAMPQPRLFTLLALLALSAGYCRRKPAAPPPAAPPAPTASASASAEPAPSPPPSCKSLDDKCEAKADTELGIGDGAATFHPPPGWTYAEESAASVATAPGSVAVLAFSTAKTAWSADTSKAIDKLLDRLEITKVARKALKTRLTHAQTKLDADGGMKIELWEVNKQRQFGQSPRLSDKPGSVLVIVTKLEDNRAIVGAAAVLKPGGEDKVPAILQAVKSLRSGK
jgi:hypothetical protein